MSQFYLERSSFIGGQTPLAFVSCNTGIESNAAVYSPTSEYITVYSPSASSWLDYGMEDHLIIDGTGIGKTRAENCAMPVDQQVCDVLSSTPEDRFLSDWEFRQMISLVQPTTSGVSGLSPQYTESSGFVVSSSPEQKCDFVTVPLSLPSPWQTVPETEPEDTAMSSVLMNTGNEDDVMDMLSQLCDTIDGDMIIDQAELAAFDSILPKMSPEDVESLLSSETQFSDVRVSLSSSSLAAIGNAPSSPASECGSTESSELSGGLPCFQKRQRKKEQNKTAALRYRQKKRSENGSVMTECEVLEKRNTELKTKVSEMIKEIDYLKGLIAEIYA